MGHCGQMYKRIIGAALVCTLLALGILPRQTHADADLQTVRVGFFAFDGYHMIDEDGDRSGYGYDILQYMAGYTDWRYEYVGYDKSWSEMQDMLANGEIDLLTSAQKTDERMERFDFSDEPIGTSSAILTVKAGSSAYMTADYENWSGMRIGVLKGNSRNDDLAAFSEEKGFFYTPVTFESTEELMTALQTGKSIDAALTSDLRAVSNEWILAKFASKPFYIMVQKGNDALLNEINRVLGLLFTDHAGLRTQLMERYYTPESGSEIAFTAEEREYITEMQGTVFNAVINPDRAPISYFSAGEAAGIIGDIAAEIIARSGLNIRIVQPETREEYLRLLDAEETDLCMDFMHSFSSAEEHGYRLTAAYLSAGISKLYLKQSEERETAGLIKNSNIAAGFADDIARQYDEVLYYDDTDELIAAIQRGECSVGYLYTRASEQYAYKDVKNRLVSEWVHGMDIDFCVAVSAAQDALLFSIMDKAVASLDESFINSAIQRHISYQNGEVSLIEYAYDNPFFLVICVTALFIMLILIVTTIQAYQRQRRERARLADETRRNALLSDALAAAEKADRSKSQFLSRMSHEMRTPLNAIIGFMELAKDATNEQRYIYRENALTAARQLLSVINDVLDMSAINTGKLRIANAPFDFSKLIHSVANIYSARCEAKGIEFQTVLETPVDEWLTGDALRLNQVLMNLLDNAVKFTDKGFVRLSIRQQETVGDRVFMRIEVADSGCGMSGEMLARLGKPFEQESAETAQKHGGSGLGLSIVKTIVSMMGGAFMADSRPGEGSTFILELSFDRSDEATKLQINTEMSDLHVLAVDDLEAECAYLSTVLGRIGVRHICVDSGAKALAELDCAYQAGDGYNVCLVDWKMPDMDGVTLTGRIREKYGKNVIVIVISAYEHQQATERAKAAGADLFVSKPLFRSSLLDLFMTLTGGHVCKAQPAAERPDFSGRRILLAEDNAMNRVVAEALVKKLGAGCETANDGKIALDMFTASEPDYYDAILMDIQMPNMDGYAATRAIRASDHPAAGTIPIIALSANAFAEDVTKSLSMGMNDHVAKPIDVEKLAAALAHAFQKHGEQ